MTLHNTTIRIVHYYAAPLRTYQHVLSTTMDSYIQCIVLQYTALHCTALHYNTLYCNALYRAFQGR